VARLQERGLARMFDTDPDSRAFVVKHFVAGMFIAIAMTGLDQEMMQKNISVRTLGGSQKNVVTLSLIMLGVVLLFLYLGGLLHLYAPTVGLDATGDRLFPAVVLGYLPPLIQVIFIVALISALFPSADGALTALTSSFCLDMLRFKDRADLTEAQAKRIRHAVHLAFAATFLLLVLAFHWADNPSMIAVILKLASYTYGPLLGLFAFGIFTRRAVRDRWVPAVAIAAPLLCLLLDVYQAQIFGAYQLGLELLALNGLLTFVGLWLTGESVPVQVRRWPEKRSE
jgi:Na+/proline symporter